VPAKQRNAVAAERFYQPDRAAADQQAAAFREKYQALYPTAITWMDRDWEACLT
jgi:transposase-like protein